MTESGEVQSKASGNVTGSESAYRQESAPEENASALAWSFVGSLRGSETPEPYERQLAQLEPSALRAVRTEQDTGLAFWLNIFNGATQVLLDRVPETYDSKWRFFRQNAVTIAGTSLSLDDIEHGILRGGKSKYGFGYLPRLARTGLARTYRLDLDPRIHFALNCGAASCPPIRRYTPDRVDESLDMATRQYLDAAVTIDADTETIVVPRLCFWYIGDFGGRSGIRQFLQEYNIIPADSSGKIQFDSYDWTKAPGRFVDE